MVHAVRRGGESGSLNGNSSRRRSIRRLCGSGVCAPCYCVSSGPELSPVCSNAGCNKRRFDLPFQFFCQLNRYFGLHSFAVGTSDYHRYVALICCSSSYVAHVARIAHDRSPWSFVAPVTLGPYLALTQGSPLVRFYGGGLSPRASCDRFVQRLDRGPNFDDSINVLVCLGALKAFGQTLRVTKKLFCAALHAPFPVFQADQTIPFPPVCRASF